MTFTYNGDPAENELATVRFLSGDTIEDEYFLEDEEINYLVAQWEDKGTLYYVAAIAAENIATKLTREIDLSSDGETAAIGQLRDRFMELAVNLRGQHQDALVGGSSLYAGGMDAYESPDATVAPLSFGTGMHDNPEAGQQDFGSYETTGTGWGEAVP